MDRDYMLAAVNHRLKLLRKTYAKACEGLTLNNKKCSPSGAACLRSRTKRDICILLLLRYLLEATTAVMITDNDAILGFDKLMKE